MGSKRSKNSPGSVTGWIEDLHQHDSKAQAKIWERFVQRLVKHANRKLYGSPCRLVDGEDIANIAFQNFFAKHPAEFVRLVDRNDLWKILRVLADRRAIDEIRKAP